jgi:hypothetical protein
MPWSRLIRFAGCLSACALLAHCSEAPAGDDDDNASGKSGSGTQTQGGSAGTSGGATPMGGSTSAGKGGAGGAATNGGSGGGSGTGTGGSTGGTGGGSGTGGGTGGSISAGGVGATGGSISSGGMGGTAGTVSPGGMGGSAGSLAPGGMGGMAGTGPITDAMGVPLAKPGDMKSGKREFLNLGDMRIINNKWGSDELGCNGTQMSVFVNQDKSVGWNFNRPMCGGAAAKPDYPEIEFGIHPFGSGSSLATSPSYSSTMVLPKQIKDIATATITFDNFAINLQQPTSWNLNFEFWLSQENPVTSANPGVYAEVIVFWGWEASRFVNWKCTESGSVNSGGKNYNLCHHDDNWANGQWRYWQFSVENGPQQNFNGTLDVKPFLEFVKSKGYSDTMWVTRFEIGSEIDDNTSGSVSLKNVTFDVNNNPKSIQLGQ